MKLEDREFMLIVAFLLFAFAIVLLFMAFVFSNYLFVGSFIGFWQGYEIIKYLDNNDKRRF